jgi:hypothetical protein
MAQKIPGPIQFTVTVNGSAEQDDVALVMIDIEAAVKKTLGTDREVEIGISWSDAVRQT